MFCEGCGRSLEEGSGGDPLIGSTVLETYRIEQLLGRGGMSVVYRGKHFVTEQDVAVKVLPPELADHADVKARFIEEARTLARLEHPNIVQLYNFVEEHGHLYLVMQYADGDNLEDIVAGTGRIAVADAVAIGIEVLRALEYAHDRNVIHRDIKPSNIVIRGDSAVKVMDFGIAKIVGGSKLTQTGQTMGTVRYMSPEQVRGKQIDHRTDLYSLAVTLYAAVCGRTPFESDNHFEIMRAHLTEAPPPPSQFAPVPPEFEQVLFKGMAKRADARFQTSAEFRAALEQVPVDRAARRITRSVPMASSLPRKRRRGVKALPVIIAAVLLLGAGAAVLWALLDENAAHRDRSDGRMTATPPPDAARPPRAWPELHYVARDVAWKVDRRYPDVQLRVLAATPRETDALRDSYRSAKEGYRTFLRDEGMTLSFRIRPLNLVVVPKELLGDAQRWPLAKTKVSYPLYLAPSATLYVRDGPEMARTDLPYGLGLHFCALISQLSNDRCIELAEGFEARFSRGAAKRP